jgi:hypothetical protein
LEWAVPVDCGEGRNNILFESCNCKFGIVDTVIVGWDEVDVHMVGSDVCFDSLGAFIVHYVEHGCIPPAGVDVGNNVCEHCKHGIIAFGRHGTDKEDGIQVANVRNKHILHVAEGSHYWEGTCAIIVHHPSV